MSDEPPTWARLFERAADYEVTESAVVAALAERRAPADEGADEP